MRAAISTPIAEVTRDRRFTPLLIWFAILAHCSAPSRQHPPMGCGRPAATQQGDAFFLKTAPTAEQKVYLPLVLRSGMQPIAGLPFNPLTTRSGEGTYYARRWLGQLLVRCVAGRS